MASLETIDGETTLTMVLGDSDDLLLTVTNEADPPAALDLSKAVDGTVSRPVVIRFAVNADPSDQDTANALVFKTSNDPTQIALLAQSGGTLGQFKVLLDKPDTDGADASSSYRWDVEVSRQDFLRTNVGTYAVSSGSGLITGTGTAFKKGKKGDVFQPLGTNAKPVLITQVLSDTAMETDFLDWTPEAGASFELRRGKSRTVARGPFVLESGVVAQ